MNIIGIILILVLPYMAGYILKTIMNNKETSQIETYLTGFFFVFLLQGILISVGYLGLHYGLDELCKLMQNMFIIAIAGFIVCLVTNCILLIKRGKHNNKYHAKMQKIDFSILILAIILAILVLVRIIDLQDYLRNDFMLSTVRTTLSTATINEYNPITSQPYTLGLITSKKIISLPVFYACLSKIFGIDETLLLYVIASIQTVLCTYFSCLLFVMPILKNRRKNYLFALFLGVLLLSGDYFSKAIGAKILWYGYSGETIVASVMLPYILYVMTQWYRDKRNDDVELNFKLRIDSSLKIIVCLFSSLFITGVSTGILLIVIEIVLFGICCLFRYKVEEVNS